MNAFLVRMLANTVALWVAVRFVPGLVWQGTATGLLGVALVLGIINAFVRPEVIELSTPLVSVTLGAFILIVNALMLWLTGEVAGVLGLTFHVAGFRAAFLGALIVTIVSTPLEMLVRERPGDAAASADRDAHPDDEAHDVHEPSPDDSERS